MKKKIKYFLLVLILLFVSCGQKATTYEAKEALSKHLVERYGEEFEIGYMGKRSDGKEVWYEAEIYPSKYVGTSKERDKYYHRRGTVNIEKGILGDRVGFVGDTYGKVKINESAEEFYGKKLKELFGDNVLQVYDIRFNRILEDYSFEKIIKVWKEEGVRLTIKGGIYIFGRVENDEDREWYRKQIYEFIQFMKGTGTFEYVALDFNIADERIISKEFEEIHLRTELIQLYEEALSNKIKGKIFIEKRKNILDKVGKNYIVDFSELEKWNKGEIINLKNKLGMAGTINLCKILSEKYIKANEHFYKDYELKSYNSINDVKIEG